MIKRRGDSVVVFIGFRNHVLVIRNRTDVVVACRQAGRDQDAGVVGAGSIGQQRRYGTVAQIGIGRGDGAVGREIQGNLESPCLIGPKILDGVGEVNVLARRRRGRPAERCHHQIGAGRRGDDVDRDGGDVGVQLSIVDEEGEAVRAALARRRRIGEGAGSAIGDDGVTLRAIGDEDVFQRVALGVAGAQGAVVFDALIGAEAVVIRHRRDIAGDIGEFSQIGGGAARRGLDVATGTGIEIRALRKCAGGIDVVVLVDSGTVGGAAAVVIQPAQGAGGGKARDEERGQLGGVKPGIARADDVDVVGAVDHDAFAFGVVRRDKALCPAI